MTQHTLSGLLFLSTFGLLAACSSPTDGDDALDDGRSGHHSDDSGDHDDSGDDDQIDDDDIDDVEVDPVILASRYMERGSHAVGFTVLEGSRRTDESLTVKAWYPAEADGDEEIDYQVALKMEGFGGGEVTILGDAALDAAPAAGDEIYPLVVLSHGFALNPEWYHPIAEHLASHGFVVLGPEHLEADWAADVVRTTTVRPGDVSATIDLAEDGVLDGIIDTENVAVIGHSYGGYTALAAAGARFDTVALAESCAGATDPFAIAYFCDPFLGYEDEMAAAMGLRKVPTDLWPSLGDDRVDAILPMSSDAILFGEQGLAEITIPTMVLGGTGDTSAPWDWGTGLAFDSVSSESRVQVGFTGAEHFIAVTTCDRMPWTDYLPAEFQYYMCEDPAWDKPEALEIINQLSTAFLLQELSGDEHAGDSLDASLYGDIEGLEMTVVLPD